MDHLKNPKVKLNNYVKNRKKRQSSQEEWMSKSFL